MKVPLLWVNNILADYPAEKLGVSPSPMGGWLMSMADKLLENGDYSMSIAAPGPVKGLSKFYDGRIMYYVIPAGLRASGYREYWDRIVAESAPDIVHLNGTECLHAEGIFEAKGKAKVVVSIQGIVGECWKWYFGGMDDCEILANVTPRDIVRRNSIFSARKSMKKRSGNELSILSQADRVIGRTDWDYAFCFKHHLESKYRAVNENLREPFYRNRWRFSECKKHTVFCSQGGVPYKGLHTVLEAISILVARYPDIQLVVAGYDLTNCGTLWNKIKISGYAKYLIGLIKKLGIGNHIKFIGMQDADGMCQEYLKANVFVQSSYIENSPNSLGEAISVGVPIVASLVGGTEKYIRHKESGLLYPAGDSTMLALYISMIFDDAEMGNRLADNAYRSRDNFYDREENVRRLVGVYNEMSNGGIGCGI